MTSLRVTHLNRCLRPCAQQHLGRRRSRLITSARTLSSGKSAKCTLYQRWTDHCPTREPQQEKFGRIRKSKKRRSRSSSCHISVHHYSPSASDRSETRSVQSSCSVSKQGRKIQRSRRAMRRARGDEWP